MDTIVGRLKNAFETGGVSEIIRKIFFKSIYDFNKKKILRDICDSQYEFGLNRTLERPVSVIVSLTTYPKRFQYLELCLKSLILQEEKPDHIIVYLGNDSCEMLLPEYIKKFEHYGIEFKIDKEKNLRSHKKYFYAMQDFPESVVITADDDIVYPKNWVRSLMDSYRNFPKCISARRVHLIKKDNDGNLELYNHWIDQYRKELNPSNAIIATGNSGILYPPHSIDERAFDVEAIQKYCFEADDIWLKCMAMLKGTKYVWVPNNEVDLPEIESGQSTCLSKENVVKNKNDEYLHSVMVKYGIRDEDFFIN